MFPFDDVIMQPMRFLKLGHVIGKETLSTTSMGPSLIGENSFHKTYGSSLLMHGNNRKASRNKSIFPILNLSFRDVLFEFPSIEFLEILLSNLVWSITQ